MNNYKKTILTIIILSFTIFLITINNPSVSAEELYSNGEGTKENPYKIENWKQLHNIRYNLDSHFKLIKDLNHNTKGYEKYGENWKPIGPDYRPHENTFSGVLNGNNHNIDNIRIGVNKKLEVTGLFKNIHHGTVKNLKMENVKIKATKYAGPIAGIGGGETIIENVKTYGIVKANGLIQSGVLGKHAPGYELLTTANQEEDDLTGGKKYDNKYSEIDNSYYQYARSYTKATFFPFDLVQHSESKTITLQENLKDYEGIDFKYYFNTKKIRTTLQCPRVNSIIRINNNPLPDIPDSTKKWYGSSDFDVKKYWNTLVSLPSSKIISSDRVTTRWDYYESYWGSERDSFDEERLLSEDTPDKYSFSITPNSYYGYSIENYVNEKDDYLNFKIIAKPLAGKVQHSHINFWLDWVYGINYDEIPSIKNSFHYSPYYSLKVDIINKDQGYVKPVEFIEEDKIIDYENHIYTDVITNPNYDSYVKELDFDVLSKEHDENDLVEVDENNDITFHMASSIKSTVAFNKKPTFEVDITDINSDIDDPIKEGENLIVDANIKNIDNFSFSQDIKLNVENETQKVIENVTLDKGEEKSITFKWNIPVGYGGDSVDIGVESETDRDENIIPIDFSYKDFKFDFKNNGDRGGIIIKDKDSDVVIEEVEKDDTIQLNPNDNLEFITNSEKGFKFVYWILENITSVMNEYDFQEIIEKNKETQEYEINITYWEDPVTKNEANKIQDNIDEINQERRDYRSSESNLKEKKIDKIDEIEMEDLTYPLYVFGFIFEDFEGIIIDPRNNEKGDSYYNYAESYTSPKKMYNMVKSDQKELDNIYMDSVKYTWNNVIGYPNDKLYKEITNPSKEYSIEEMENKFIKVEEEKKEVKNNIDKIVNKEKSPDFDYIDLNEDINEIISIVEGDYIPQTKEISEEVTPLVYKTIQKIDGDDDFNKAIKNVTERMYNNSVEILNDLWDLNLKKFE